MKIQNLEIKQAKTKDEIEGALAVRKKVFVEEQKIDINIERDCHDWFDATHIIVLSGINFVGAGRFIPTKDGVKIQRMAVLSEYREKGIGGQMLLKIIDLIKEKGFERIYLSAQKTAEGLYKKYGFNTYGDVFEEVGLPHIMMEKYLIPVT